MYIIFYICLQFGHRKKWRCLLQSAHIFVIEAIMMLSQNENAHSPERFYDHPKVQSAKKTAFAPLPNVTTWYDKQAFDDELPENSFQPSQMQGLNIKLALEEKRRKLQLDHSKKGKDWIQQTKKAGETAFMQFANQQATTPSEVAPEDHLYEEINENRPNDETVSQLWAEQTRLLSHAASVSSYSSCSRNINTGTFL